MTEQVMIDGVLYVPATSAIANAEAIEKGLASLFYGMLGFPHDGGPEQRWEGLRVLVYDDGQGNTIDETLAAITQFAKGQTS